MAQKDQKNQYPAYAVKSDDGKNQECQYPNAYAANYSDDGEKLNTETRTINFYYMSPLRK